MAAFAPGCGSDDPGTVPGTGGTGGSGATGGSGGTGGTGGTQTGCEEDADCDNGQRCNLETNLCENRPCEIDSECNEDEICIEGACRPMCKIDSDCGFNNGTRCDDDAESETYGRCIPGEPCQGDVTCGTTAGYEYCDNIGVCVCVPDDSVGEFMTGVCRRRTPFCSPCNSSADCGPDRVIFNQPAECKTYTYDDGDANVCLPKKGTGACPAGMVPANQETHPHLAGYCVPQTQDCSDMSPCVTNEDCAGNPEAPICDRTRQICIPGCKYDFDIKRSQGCAPNEVCHATPGNLDPELLADCSTVGLFGQGQCGSQCETDQDCLAYDESGGFVCKQEAGSPEKRCRPAGCLDDKECPEGGVFLGYCDIKADYTQNSCVTDTCRPGIDPRAGCGADEPYEDCNADYKCVAGGGTGRGECVEKNCIDHGGAANGCRLGEFCAGEPLLNMMTGEEEGTPVTPPENVPPGECYALTPLDRWCGTGCGSNDDCVDGPYSYTDTPGICMVHPDNQPRCNWGCEYSAECPGRWTCSSAGLELGCDGLKICEADADCGTGNRCVEPQVGGRRFTNWGDAAPFKVCECSDTGACGAGFSCNAGIATAATDPGTPDSFEKRTARYCAANDGCGTNGSCEWFGNLVAPGPGAPPEPVYRCGATPEGSSFPGAGTPVQVECPSSDAQGNFVRQGKTMRDQYMCVYSSVCQPRYYLDTATDELVCGAQPATPRP
ncbi:hypothetical protein [Vulgatibacter sp.]|uniref:hypothetical protein n=1 Tax=Vulgatibacter sp. TaxID=1971226 RepID=UPI003564A62B